jgi:alpha-ribazole phosphatase
MRMFLFRHGEVERSDIFFGQFDNPLSDRGRLHSQAIAECVSELDLAAVYCSDLGRAVDAARLVSKRTGLPFSSDARLRELHLGWADGMVCEEAFEREPELREAKYEWLLDRPLTSGGETVAEVATRVRDLREELTEKHRGRKVLLVGHNTPNRILLADALGLPLEKIFSFRQDFGCLNIVEYGETRARLALLNADPDRYRPGVIR